MLAWAAAPELRRAAAQRREYALVDQRCEGCTVRFREQQPPPPALLPHPTYYVGGVNEAQRAVYDEHCEARFAQRSPYHFSSVEEVGEKEMLAGTIWRRRVVYEVQSSFVSFDGLLVQPPACDCDSSGPITTRQGRLYLFERLPGFNGLGRLVVLLDSLGLLRVAPDGHSVSLRPADLTLSAFTRRHKELVGTLPAERGIENVHAFTYAKTFPSNGSSVEDSALTNPLIESHECLMIIEQYWTVNYWHWTTDALPKVHGIKHGPIAPGALNGAVASLATILMVQAGSFRASIGKLLALSSSRHARNIFQVFLFAELLRSPDLAGCKLLTYDLPWVREHLSLVGIPSSAILHHAPRALHFGGRVLVSSPSALDAPHAQQLATLRHALLAHVPGASLSAAAHASVGTSRPLMLAQHRKGNAGSVHGEAREISNFAQLLSALQEAVSRGGSELEVVAFDHTRHSVAEQVALYSRARVIIGVHGAGFANILWAPAGCHVVEIVPIDVHLDFQCGLTPFWYVAELLLLRKHAFVAYSGRMFESFELPVVEFLAFLRASAII